MQMKAAGELILRGAVAHRRRRQAAHPAASREGSLRYGLDGLRAQWLPWETCITHQQGIPRG